MEAAAVEVLVDAETWSLLGAVSIKLLTFWWPIVLFMATVAIREWSN